MDQLKKLVCENPMAVLVLLAVAVVLVVYMLWSGCKLSLPNKAAEGVGAGGPQVNDNALLPAGWEGYSVRRFEGASGAPSVRGALASENAASLRAELGCKAPSYYRKMASQQLVKTAGADPGFAMEGVRGSPKTATNKALAKAMIGM